METSVQPRNKPLYKEVVGGNRQVILSVVEQYRLITAPLIARLTELPLGTVQNNLTRLSEAKLISEQRISIHDPYLYWAKGKPAVSHIDHELSLSESRVALTMALRKRNGSIGRGCLSDTEFMGSGPVRKLEGAGKAVIPDWSLIIFDQGRRLYGFWEEDKGTMRRKDDEYYEKYATYLAWRTKFCHDTNGVNPWGMKAFRVFTMVETDRRLETLRGIARTVSKSSLFWFTSRARWCAPPFWKETEDTVEYWKLGEESIWVTAKDDQPRRLTE
jgi:hypothetical protein